VDAALLPSWCPDARRILGSCELGGAGTSIPLPSAVVLTAEQMRTFATDGYVIVKGVVPEHLLVAADDEAERMLEAFPPDASKVGPHFVFLPPGDLPASDAALRASPALATAEELVAPHRLDHGLDHIQIAWSLPPQQHHPGGPHIDGHRPEQDAPASFTMLAAIFLGDESQADRGNLWVWPGSHLRYEQMFAERGSRVLLPVSGHPTMLSPPVPHPRAVPVFADRGDLLLAHFLLGHNSSGNLSDVRRRVLYYRLACDGHAARWEQTFLDVFTEYAPLRALRPPRHDGVG
jgi:hypothetical protein